MDSKRLKKCEHDNRMVTKLAMIASIILCLAGERGLKLLQLKAAVLDTEQLKSAIANLAPVTIPYLNIAVPMPWSIPIVACVVGILGCFALVFASSTADRLHGYDASEFRDSVGLLTSAHWCFNVWRTFLSWSPFVLAKIVFPSSSIFWLLAAFAAVPWMTVSFNTVHLRNPDVGRLYLGEWFVYFISVPFRLIRWFCIAPR